MSFILNYRSVTPVDDVQLRMMAQRILETVGSRIHARGAEVRITKLVGYSETLGGTRLTVSYNMPRNYDLPLESTSSKCAI